MNHLCDIYSPSTMYCFRSVSNYANTVAGLPGLHPHQQGRKLRFVVLHFLLFFLNLVDIN